MLSQNKIRYFAGNKRNIPMITYLKINGFKSFHNFEMEFTPLTIVAGTNAAGKSNLFDALNLLSRLAEVDKIHTAFREGQRGDLFELFTQYDEHAYADEMEVLCGSAGKS